MKIFLATISHSIVGGTVKSFFDCSVSTYHEVEGELYIHITQETFRNRVKALRNKVVLHDSQNYVGVVNRGVGTSHNCRYCAERCAVHILVQDINHNF